MKTSKTIISLFGAVVLITAGIYGYILFRQYTIKKELQLAVNYYKNGELSAVIKHLNNIREKTPDSPLGQKALHLLAKSYTSLGKLNQAEASWEKLQQLEGISNNWKAECLFNLARIASETSNIPLAVKKYNMLISKFPNSELADNALWNLASIYKEKGELLPAKQALESITENYPQSNLMDSVQKETGDINIKLLFSPAIIPGSKEYTVQKGDTLAGIAQRFKTTVELIKICNNLKTNFIKKDMKLKVITLKFSILIDKSRNTLILKADESVIKIYSVGTGAKGSTPVGEFQIKNKLINPPWYKAGIGIIPYGNPKNILGTRWMGLNIGGYGIHGTWDPNSTGKQVSAGCIRMRNKDVEELFKIVPIGTSVTVVN